MSRYGYWDGPCDQLEMLAAARWRGQVESVLRGQRGRGQVCALAHALLAMPRRRLIEGEIVSADGEVCFVGAYAVQQQAARSGRTWEATARRLRHEYTATTGPCQGEFLGNDAAETEALGEAEGLARQVAAEAAWLNDEAWGSIPPEERWQLALAWCWAQLAFPRVWGTPGSRHRVSVDG